MKITQQKFIKDCQWAVNAPVLFSINKYQLPKLTLDETVLEGFYQQHIDNIQRQTRLGHYFEVLWFAILNQQHHIDAIKQSLAITVDKKTLGEIDFLYRLKRWFHLELAIKFYLCPYEVPSTFSQHWVGPNNIDRLDLKSNRMIDHQSKLLLNNFQTVGLNEPPTTIALMQGVRFIKDVHCFESQTAQQFLSKRHALLLQFDQRFQNIWMSLYQYKLLQRSMHHNIKWYYAHKLEWLTLNSVAPHNKVCPLPPFMVIALNNQTEVFRFMVTADNWQQESIHTIDQLSNNKVLL